MKYLFIKFGRDIRKLWSQFFSVFIMAMISLTIFAGMGCVWNGMKVSSEQYEKDTNLADAWITGENFSEDELNFVRDISYVKHAEPSMTFSVDCTIDDVESDIRLTSFTEDAVTVMKPLTRSGESMYGEGKKEDREGIWIDEDYAEANGIKEGDNIEISIGGMEFEVKVKGIVLHSENIFFLTSGTDTMPDHERHGYGYIEEDYVKSLLGNVIYNQLRIELSDQEITKETLQKDVGDVLGEKAYQVAFREDMQSIIRIEDEQEQVRKMAMLFSVVFVLLSLLAMYTTMSRLVNNQVVQIGTMKALGYSNSSIYGHYACYGLAVALFGGGIGILLGRIFISEIVMNIKKATLTLPEWKKELPLDCFILWVAIVLICTCSALLTTRKVIKGVPAQTIRGIIGQKEVDKKELKRSKLSYGWLWTLRSIKVHPARTIMGVIAVAGSLILMVAGVGVWDSLNTSYDTVFEDEYTYKYAATIKRGEETNVMEQLSDEVVQYADTISATFYTEPKYKEEENEYAGVITVLSDGNLIHLFSEDGEDEIQLPKEGAVVTNKIAKELGIEKGDTIYYKDETDTERKGIEVKNVVDARMPQGIFVSEDAWEEEFVPNTVYLKDEKGYELVEDSGLTGGLISREEQRDNMDEMLKSVQSVVYILIMAAFVLSAVILYNLGTLNYIERYREYATMKVLGFYKKEINRMVMKDCILNLLVGLVIGVPGSLAFLKVYVSVISMENVEWIPYINPLHFVVVAIVVIAFSIMINSLVCAKIKKVNMVEALKSID